MTLNQVTFAHVLAVIALLILAAVVFDLSTRGLHRDLHRPQWPKPGASGKLCREAIVAHGCGACHVIPGVGLAVGRVGPKLDDFANQTFIAGILPNHFENLVSWIRHPDRINPDTAMPNLDVNTNDARNIAAYLYEAQ